MASPVVANKEGGAVSIVTADSNGSILGDQSWLQSYVKEKSIHALQSRASGVTGKTVTPGKAIIPGKSPTRVSAHAQDFSADRPDFTSPALNGTQDQPSSEMESDLILKLFGSQEAAAPENEMETAPVDQHWMNRHVFHPEAPARRNWDMIAICLVVYTVFVLPTRTAFFWQYWNDNPDESRKWDGWVIMDVSIDGFFLLDVVFNFFTGFYESTDEDVVIMNGPDIAWRYLKGWLILDVMASLPLDLVVLGGNRTLMKLPRLLKILRLSRLLRLLRLSRMLRYIKRIRLFEYFHISSFQIRIVKLFCTEVTFLHWSACIQWLVVAATDFPENSWASREDLVFKPISDQYSWAFFRALSHMLCIGYGLEPPFTLGDAWTMNISMLSGASLFAVFVGIITSLLIQLDTGTSDYNAKLEVVNHYMAHRHLPVNLRQRIRDNYEFRWKNQKAFDEQEILQELPVSLRTEVAIHNCHDLLEMVPFFMDCEKGLIASVVTLLKPTVFLNGEIIIREGETSKGMFFIRYGEVQVSTDDQVITYLTQGSYFGEIGLVKGSHRTADVSTTKDCELYYLSKADFHEVFDSFPEAAKTMGKIADHRLTALEWYKRQVQIKEERDQKMQEQTTLNPVLEMLNSLEKDQDGQGVDIPQDKVHDLAKLSKLPSKKKAMLKLSTFGKTSSDSIQVRSSPGSYPLTPARSSVESPNFRRRSSSSFERQSTQVGARWKRGYASVLGSVTNKVIPEAIGSSQPSTGIDNQLSMKQTVLRVQRAQSRQHAMYQSTEEPESPTVRPATAFEVMLGQRGLGTLKDMGIESKNIDLEGAQARVRRVSNQGDNLEKAMAAAAATAAGAVPLRVEQEALQDAGVPSTSATSLLPEK